MRDPARPDTQQDEYIPDLASAHRPPANPNPGGTGITPMDPSSMPRGEDDEKTRRRSPAFHDRPDAPLPPQR